MSQLVDNSLKRIVVAETNLQVVEENFAVNKCLVEEVVGTNLQVVVEKIVVNKCLMEEAVGTNLQVVAEEKNLTKKDKQKLGQM